MNHLRSLREYVYRLQFLGEVEAIPRNGLQGWVATK